MMLQGYRSQINRPLVHYGIHIIIMITNAIVFGSNIVLSAPLSIPLVLSCRHLFALTVSNHFDYSTDTKSSRVDCCGLPREKFLKVFKR